MTMLHPIKELLSFQAKRLGQGSSEYALGIGLVLVIGIAGLSALGLRLNEMFSGMITEAPPAGTEVASLSEGGGAGGNGSSGSLSSGRVVGTEPVCLSPGSCIDIPFIGGQNDVIETSGGQGAEYIHQFASTLEALAKQLEQAGEDPALVQLISKLALQGHGLGDTQAAAASKVNKYMLVGDSLALQSRYKNSQQSFETAYSSLMNHINNRETPLNPMAMEIIQTQSNQISTLAKAVNIGAASSRKGNNTYFGSTGHNVTFGTAQLTHQSSNTICNQGGQGCYRPL
jgi:hypothetical protein